MFQVKEATGCPFDRTYLLKEERRFDICDFGAGENIPPVENTRAINRAVLEASERGGGTVVVPEGKFRIYTVQLKSRVNLYLSEGSVLQAARTDIRDSYETQTGEGGNYLEPEINPYFGLQDHGHTYFANSLIYGADLSDVMIYGPGLMDGSFLNDEGEREHVLMGGDPFDPDRRDSPGHRGEWFGNKAVALVRCRNVILSDFTILAGGHFAIITTCVENMLVENILVDTNRDAIDVDCCENVTVTGSRFNSLTDDAVVLKASYGGGKFMPLKNVLIEDCKVSGYDMGSVYSGEYTSEKLVATDRCGPTARVKLGTESTCGYDQVTVRRIEFSRSRGFALEAVDGADLSNILFEDSVMDNLSSSPLFIRIGDRCRFPVTGQLSSEEIFPEEGDVRLENRQWVLPGREGYDLYPVLRYTPAYNRSKRVCIDGHSDFDVVNPSRPCLLNRANYEERDGKYFARRYDSRQGAYVTDDSAGLDSRDVMTRGNGKSREMAKVFNIIIRNITATNIDPRYPAEIMGLMGSPVKNVLLENISLTYRGGLSLQHATEQRQLNTNWEYAQNGKKERPVQSLPWLVNTFFLKHEGLLPRADWVAETGEWKDSPFNVPELPEVYPEPSNWGILPAYGLYARHVENLNLKNVTLSFETEDTRYPIVLDDVRNGSFDRVGAMTAADGEIAAVTNHCKRPACFEYVPDYPYTGTGVEGVGGLTSHSVKEITVAAPAPGTPKDSLYTGETAALPENGYAYAVKTEDYPLPQTVYRPFFRPCKTQSVPENGTVSFEVLVRQPAYEVSRRQTSGMIYNETVEKWDFSVGGMASPLTLACVNLPEGAIFDTSGFEPGRPVLFSWTPFPEQDKTVIVTFVCDDGIGSVGMDVSIETGRRS